LTFKVLYQMRTSKNLGELKILAKSIRKNVIEILVPSVSHHIGCSLGIIEILTVLYGNVMKIFPKDPKNVDRDIFILSKGHGAVALYSTLYNLGYFKKKLLMSYDAEGTIIPEHASTNVPGVEVSTGSLGHGLPIGLGFSFSFLRDDKKNKVFVLMSDGELNEGSNWEAIQYAGHHKVNNLTIIIDKNNFQGLSDTKSVIDLDPLDAKFKVFGWNVIEVDGNNIEELLKVFSSKISSNTSRPLCIIANTVKGKGVSSMEGKFESHYKSLSKEVKEQIINELS